MPASLRPLWIACSCAWLVACTGAPPSAEPVEALPEAFVPEHAEGRSPSAWGRVLGVSWERGSDGNLIAHLELVLGMLRPFQWNGMQTAFRTVVFEASKGALWVDGVALTPVGEDRGPGSFKDRLDISAEGDGVVRGTLVVPIGVPQPPASMRLVLRNEEGALELPILGPLADDDGRTARPVLVVDAAGRPLHRDVALSADGVAVAAPAPTLWWRAPAGSRELVATAPGREPARWSGDQGGPVTLVLRPARDTTAGALAHAVEVPAPAREEVSLDALAERMRDVDDVGAYVRSLAVLPVSGIARSPLTVARLGAGSPLERAELARALLLRVGARAVVGCGDVARDAIPRVFGTAPRRTLPEPFAAEAATTRALADGLVPGLEAALAEVGGVDDSARARVRLVPEWCWPRVADGADGWTDLDLRPASEGGQPLPVMWRTTDDTALDRWRVVVVMMAMTATGPQDAAEYGTVLLGSHDLSAAVLTDGALVFDLVPDALFEGPPQMRAYLTFTDGRVVGARQGASVDRTTLDSVGIQLELLDPQGVSTARSAAVIWSRDRDLRSPDRVRAVLSGDPGLRSPDLVWHHLRDALDARSAMPGVSAVLAQHARIWLLARQGTGGLEGAEPSFLLTALSLTEGEVTSTTSEVHAPAPGFVGDDAIAPRIARLAAGRAAALAVAGALPGAPWEVAAPDRWSRGDRPYEELGRIDQWQLRRVMGGRGDGFVFGANPATRSIWSWHPVRGALGDTGWRQVTRPWVPGPAAPDGEGPNDPLTVHRAWDRHLVCAELPRWGGDAAAVPVCGPGAP